MCRVDSDMYALGCMTELFREMAVWSDMSPHTIILKVIFQLLIIDHLPPKIRSIVSLCFVAADKGVAQHFEGDMLVK